MRVEVAYAGPEGQAIIELEVPVGTTAMAALAASGMAARFPAVDFSTPMLGVFGEPVAADRVLNEHDRVEIYRPLVADPKEARRRKAGRRR